MLSWMSEAEKSRIDSADYISASVRSTSLPAVVIRLVILDPFQAFYVDREVQICAEVRKPGICLCIALGIKFGSSS